MSLPAAVGVTVCVPLAASAPLHAPLAVQFVPALEDHVTTEGMRIRRLTDLVLVRAHHPLFALGWNIMHVIDETSPLFAADHDSLEALRAAFVLTLSGTDETTGQVLMARAEYRADALRWNESFRDILEVAADGTLQIDYGKFHDVEPFRELRSS